jgi:hypothetical protein
LDRARLERHRSVRDFFVSKNIAIFPERKPGPKSRCDWRLVAGDAAREIAEACLNDGQGRRWNGHFANENGHLEHEF